MKSKRKHTVLSAKGATSPAQQPADSVKSITPNPNNPWLVAGICFFLAVIVWIVFGQTRRYEFVNYDDNQFVYGSPVVTHGLTSSGIISAFRAPGMDNWIPLATLSHMLDYQFYGLKAGGHHLTNVLLHATTVILLFLVLRQMTSALWRSAFVAAVFAIHPLGVESVAWVTERKDILSGFFFVLTLWAYTGFVRSQKKSFWYLGTLFFAVLGLMSKPMLVTLPFVLLLLDYWPLRRFEGASAQPTRTTIQRLIVEKIPFFLLSGAACVVTLILQHAAGAVKTLTTVSVPMRIENAFVSYALYLGKIFWPVHLAVLYPRADHWPASLVFFSALLLAVLCLVAVALRKKFPFMLTGWFWFAGMLVPVIGLVQVGEQAMADRYAYLPQIGLYLLLAWLVSEVSGRLPHRVIILSGLTTIILIGLIWRAREQTSYWRNSETLWTHTLACTSNNLIAHYNYGNYLLQRGQANDAISQYQDALTIDSHNAVARNNLGTALLQKGQTNQAIAQYQQTIRDDPGYILAHINLGNTLLPRGQVQEAITQYQEALKIEPGNSAALHNLGNALLQNGQVNEAISQYREEITNDPDYAPAYYNLGNALQQKGQLDEAISQYQQSLKLDPRYAQAHINLGIALVQKGRLDEGISEYELALKIDSNNAAAHNNLGNALLQKGRLDEVITQYQEALKIEPRDAAARNNLAAVFLQKGEIDKAAVQYEEALEIHPEDRSLQNGLAHAAWILATSSDPAIRNGQVAAEVAQRANQLTKGNNPVILRVLAAAYAENGHFPEAIETGQRGLALAREQQIAPLITVLQQDIEHYQAGSPVREH
jgi:tetratricopeptide (TPR) repeat protein